MHDDSTTFSLIAADLDLAVQDAVDHLRSVVVEEGRWRGFAAPELLRESFELVDGEWRRVFQFRAVLLPERA